MTAEQRKIQQTNIKRFGESIQFTQYEYYYKGVDTKNIMNEINKLRAIPKHIGVYTLEVLSMELFVPGQALKINQESARKQHNIVQPRQGGAPPGRVLKGREGVMAEADTVGKV